MSDEQAGGVEQLELTDDGLEAPEDVVGRAGLITVEKPPLKMEITFKKPVRELEPELLTFPPTGERNRGYDIPEGHVRIEGTLYEIDDQRDLGECPHCGSDKVAAHDEPPRCYTCETDLESGIRADGGTDADGVERRCSTCDGTGSVESEKQVDAGEYVVESDLCPDCGGSGERPLQSPYGGGNDE